MTVPLAPPVVNGDPAPDTQGLPLDELVARLVPGCVVDGRPQGVAIAVNEAVVPRGLWGDTRVAAGDRIEIVTAVQGG